MIRAAVVFAELNPDLTQELRLSERWVRPRLLHRREVFESVSVAKQERCRIDIFQLENIADILKLAINEHLGSIEIVNFAKPARDFERLINLKSLEAISRWIGHEVDFTLEFLSCPEVLDLRFEVRHRSLLLIEQIVGSGLILQLNRPGALDGLDQYVVGVPETNWKAKVFRKIQ